MNELAYFPAPLPKIVGGSYAQPGEFPYQLELVWKGGKHKCGAALVSSMLALTAAHCVYRINASDLAVVGGEYRRDQLDGTEQTSEIQKIIIHENVALYEKGLVDNDIALLVLSNQIQINEFTRPVVIATNSTKLRKVAISTGWGRSNERNKSAENTLKKASLPLVAKDKCDALYFALGEVVAENTICAGGSGPGSCNGDSGGALTCIGKSGDKFMCGLVSWGIRCSSKYPTVYSDVRKYIDWIEMKISQLRAENICKPEGGQCDITYDGRPPAPAIVPIDDPCSSEEFYCLVNKKCIPLVFRCDQDFDCGDGDASDEVNCTLTNLIDNTITTESSHAHTISPPRPCRPTEFQCLTSKLCLPTQFLCDGEDDCGHGDTSDEQNCTHDEMFNGTSDSNYYNSSSSNSISTPYVCRPDQLQCNLTKACISSESRCNRENDCGTVRDLSDEEFCGFNLTNAINLVLFPPPIKIVSSCGPEEFQCRRTKRCIPKRFVCDANDDCSVFDYSDEEYCQF